MIETQCARSAAVPRLATAFRAGSTPRPSVPGRRCVEVGKHHGWLCFVVGWYFAAVTGARQHRFRLRNASTAPHRATACVRRRPGKSVAARQPAWTFAACCRPCHRKARRCERRGRDYSGADDSGKPHVRGVAHRLRHDAATIAGHAGRTAPRPGRRVSGRSVPRHGEAADTALRAISRRTSPMSARAAGR